jgi:hypothetical protein
LNSFVGIESVIFSAQDQCIDIPTLLCTGFSAAVSESQARAFGIKELTLKPLVQTELAVLL